MNPPQNSARGGFGAILGGLGGTMGDRGGRGVTGGRGGGLGVIMGGGMGGGFGSRGGGLGGIIGGGGFGGRQGLGGGRMGGDGMGDVLGGTRISRGGRITDDRDSTRGGGHLGGGIGGRGVGEVGIGGLPTLGGTAPLKKLFKKVGFIFENVVKECKSLTNFGVECVISHGCQYAIGGRDGRGDGRAQSMNASFEMDLI